MRLSWIPDSRDNNLIEPAHRSQLARTNWRARRSRWSGVGPDGAVSGQMERCRAGHEDGQAMRTAGHEDGQAQAGSREPVLDQLSAPVLDQLSAPVLDQLLGTPWTPASMTGTRRYGYTGHMAQWTVLRGPRCGSGTVLGRLGH